MKPKTCTYRFTSRGKQHGSSGDGEHNDSLTDVELFPRDAEPVDTPIGDDGCRCTVDRSEKRDHTSSHEDEGLAIQGEIEWILWLAQSRLPIGLGSLT